jgi:signal peptidase II
MKPLLKRTLLALALLSLIACDQVVKTIARDNLALSPPVSYLDGLVRLMYTENPGSFLGLGAQLPETVRTVLGVLTGAAVIVGLLLLFKYSTRMHRIKLLGFTLLLGGACGNLVDRVTNEGRVIDFMVLGVGGIHTGVFNIADVFILAGVIIAVFASGKRQPSN